MKTLALAATALTLGVVAASAQSQPGEGGMARLTPEQLATVRGIIKETLRRNCGRGSRSGLRISLPGSRRSSGMPLGPAIRARLAAEVRDGLADRLSDRVSDLRERTPASGSGRASGEIRAGADRLATLTPEQRAAVRGIIRERLPEELRDRLAERLADQLATLTPEQRDAVRTAIRARLAAEVREGLADRPAPCTTATLGYRGFMKLRTRRYSLMTTPTLAGRSSAARCIRCLA